MAHQHIDDDVLMDYADSPESVGNRADVERRLAECTECWLRLDDYRSLAAAMRNGETWQIADEKTGGEGLQAFRDFGARLALEDEEATRMLGTVLESQYRFAYMNIARRKRFQTGGVVRLLCARAHQECDNEPLYALELAETAQVIAEALPDTYYPAAVVNELRGMAWKEYSTACGYLHRFDEGYYALDRAARAYRRLVDHGAHLAAVDLGRAILLWKQQRYDEALPFAQSAAAVFAERCDTFRYFSAKEVEAVIQQRQGNLSGACETYRKAFDYADTVDDLEMKARAAHNLGVAYQDCGDIVLASQYLLTALQLYQGLEQRAMVAKTQWAIARVSLLADRFAEAAGRLPFIKNELGNLGMKGEAALVELDIAEANVMLGRFAEVNSACRALVEFFSKASMLGGALTAAYFLKEAAAKLRLTRDDISHVRRYLVELERSPDLPFTPPLRIN